MADQTAQITWRDGTTPVSVQFDDPYFSLNGGLAESRHVFLRGNHLPARFAPGFHIAELGFGTGLNMLVAWHAWNQSGLPGPLQFTSFERYPMSAVDIATALTPFVELSDLTGLFLANWTNSKTRLALPGLDLHIVFGDASDTLPTWSGVADAWFLDGFSPAKNPELWTSGLLHQVATHTELGGTVATYSAAGHVRRALSNAGFMVARAPGYGQKRHMTVGEKSADR